MLKKASHKSVAVKDVHADNPEGTLDRLADGLRRVLAVPQSVLTQCAPKRSKARAR
jgi:hypothetical protein